MTLYNPGRAEIDGQSSMKAYTIIAANKRSSLTVEWHIRNHSSPSTTAHGVSRMITLLIESFKVGRADIKIEKMDSY